MHSDHVHGARYTRSHRLRARPAVRGVLFASLATEDGDGSLPQHDCGGDDEALPCM